jgi:hypothetical protein
VGFKGIEDTGKLGAGNCEGGVRGRIDMFGGWRENNGQWEVNDSKREEFALVLV